MINKIESHEDGSIKSIAFLESASFFDMEVWFRFVHAWNGLNREEAFKILQERDRVR